MCCGKRFPQKFTKEKAARNRAAFLIRMRKKMEATLSGMRVKK